MQHMTSRERLLTALDNKKPDRLPVTTHTLQKYYLDMYENSISFEEFFSKYGMDRIDWVRPFKPDITKGQYWSDTDENGFEGIVADDWRITSKEILGENYPTKRYFIDTPSGQLSMVVQSNQYTSWVMEHLLKEKKEIEIIAKHAPNYICDVALVNDHASRIGHSGIVRGVIPSFDIYGQPGCWQDAAVLLGIQNIILATFDDPDWIKELLLILQQRKLAFIRSMKGAKIDINELGGGDASTTVISPAIFNEFVAPYDMPLIQAAHSSGQRIAYHTCGGMMPILEDIADMNPDVMETFTPLAMGADVDLAEAYSRIGDRVCFIGGFDQGTYFLRSTPDETKAEVKRCFDACGLEGGYIISPSDHFFDAKPELLRAFSEAAKTCTY